MSRDRTTRRPGVTRLVAAAGLAAAASAGLAQQQQDLPITDITLYRSGVGHFVRSGTVEGDANVSLSFRTEQINDILKSMHLLDMGGGEIEAVSYASREPLKKRLSSFAIDISDSPDLPTLLSRLRGARIAVETVDGRTTGTIVGIERRPEPAGDSTIPVARLNLRTEAGIESVAIRGVSSFQLLDDQLAGELDRALAALAEHRTDTVKSVDLAFRGEGARDAVVAYVHEMPVWKTSYRLVLPDETGGQPTIQGWAIVENTTDADWENVRLSLVAGQPVSFTMDLYQPLFIDRPHVPVPVMRGVGPRVYEGGREDVRDQRRLAQSEERSRQAGGGGGGQSPFQDPQKSTRAGAPVLSAEDMTGSAARARATAAEMGEVFQYRVDAPVSIDRQQSAMLPILSSEIEGRRVSIYNAGDLENHPMRGVELTNSSGLQLMPGPISVFDGAAFAGDARIDHVPQDDERLLSYAVDQSVRADAEQTQSGRVETVRIVNGSIEQVTRSVREHTYRFDNKDTDRARTIILEHPRHSGWELVEPESPAETTGDLYRFELAIPEGESRTMAVRQQRTDRSSHGITEYDLDTLLRYQKMGHASDAVVEAFREARNLRGRVAETEQRIERLERERRSISDDQRRIRENMARIGEDSDLYRRYMTKLSEQETRLETIEEDLTKARDEREKRQQALDAYIRDLEVE